MSKEDSLVVGRVKIMKECHKVVIVDDEMLIRQGIINYINWEKEGFEIVGEASNGEEALLTIDKYRPHIVITDIVMPVMNGIDFVKVVKKDYPDIEIIVLSSFENFDYVRSTFQSGVADYILKPKLNGEELLKTLHKVTNKATDFQEIKETNEVSIDKIIRKLLSGYEPDYDEKIVSDYFSNNQFCLLAIYWQEKQTDPSQLDVIFRLLREYFKEINFYPILEEKTGITFLLNFNSDQLTTIKTTINEINNDTVVILGDATKWVLSSQFVSIKAIKKIYDETLLLMNQYLFYLPELSVLINDDLPHVEERNQSFNLNQFIEILKSKQFKVAFKYVEDYVDYLANQYTSDVFEFKSFLGNIIFNIIVLLANLNYDTKGLENDKYAYFSGINEAKDAKEAIDQFNSFLDVANKIVLAKEENVDQYNVQRLLDYIEEHYTEPLSLTDIAKHFHFNPSYLSTYFSRHHNEGFSEYINRVRIKKARQLLQNSTVSISDISRMVGYSDHSYFCKVFKKETGNSPSTYRKEFST